MALDVIPPDRFAYVTNFGSNTVSVIATATDTVVEPARAYSGGDSGAVNTAEGISSTTRTATGTSSWSRRQLSCSELIVPWIARLPTRKQRTAMLLRNKGKTVRSVTAVSPSRNAPSSLNSRRKRRRVVFPS